MCLSLLYLFSFLWSSLSFAAALTHFPPMRSLKLYWSCRAWDWWRRGAVSWGLAARYVTTCNTFFLSSSTFQLWRDAGIPLCVLFAEIFCFISCCLWYKPTHKSWWMPSTNIVFICGLLTQANSSSLTFRPLTTEWENDNKAPLTKGAVFWDIFTSSTCRLWSTQNLIQFILWLGLFSNSLPKWWKRP